MILPVMEKSDCPRRRLMAMTAAGSYRANLERCDGDCHYITWGIADATMTEWGFSVEECDEAWRAFRARHSDTYPGGSWQESEREFLDKAGGCNCL